MPSSARDAEDAVSFFLLPFEEVPHCTPVGDSHSTAQSRRKDVSFSSSIGPERTDSEHFSSFVVQRTTNKLLPDGPHFATHSGKFLVKIGQNLLLRPEENSIRPGVAELLDIFREKGKKEISLRVRWYYRGEDLTEKPAEAVGEDEIFQTQHFDDVDADSVAGRCRVMSYVDWILFTEAKRRSKLRLKEKHLAAEQRDRLAAQNETRGREKVVQNSKQDPATLEQASDNRKSAVTPKPSDDDDVLIQKKADKEIEKDSSAPQDESGCDSEDEDLRSTFRENYPESSLFYYCRRFYDPASNTLLVSKHENKYADPLEELAALRVGYGDRDCHDNEEFRPDGSKVSSSDEDDDVTFYAEDGDFEDGQRKRKRRTGKQKKIRKGERSENASQFSLPCDIGVPPSLPCRDSQKAHVRKFFLDAINGATEDGQSGSRCLYISGVPGTGKTATVREVTRDLTALRSNGSLAPFEVIEINAMSLPDPNLVYAELYAALTGNRNVSPSHAAHLLETRFSTCAGAESRKTKQPRRGPQGRGQNACTIVILDEMDVLLARKQKVLYDMLEWPTRKNSRMAVIGIANTMDLPERILPRLGSRLGLNRLSYPPYTSSQLETILEMTLDTSKAEFAPAAIQLCVKKVGSVSGDVRRALELCQRATDILLEGTDENNPKRGKSRKRVVKPTHMQAAIQDIAGGARLVALNQLSVYERLVLGSALNLARTQGSSAVEKTCSMAAVVAEVVNAVTTKTFKEDFDVPSTYELEEACWRLAGWRIVIIETAAVPRDSRIIVNVSADDCLFAFRECDVMRVLLDAL